MKDPNKKVPVILAGSMFILLGAAIMLVFVFMGRNRTRIEEQNRQYLQDAASQTVKRVDEIFDNAEISIRMVSRLYELQLDEPEFDYNMLNEMSEPTPFDYIRFISPEGVSYSGDGDMVECFDREYYCEGIKGNTGVCHFYESRFTGEPIFSFYTPLYYEEEIIGVVCGVINSNSFAESFNLSIFNEPSNPCICTSDGNIICAPWKSDNEFARNSENLFEEALEPGIAEKVRKALADGSEISFNYKGTAGEGIAFLAPLSDGKYLLAQTFPSAVTDAITRRANQDALSLEIAMMTLFVLYILFLVIYSVRRSNLLSRENEDLGQIVDSVKRLYRRFVIFDLEEDTYEYLKEGDINALGILAEGTYSEWLEVFRKRHSDAPDCWGPMEDMTKEHLQENITAEQWYGHREYRTPDGRWERLSLIKLDETDPTCRILGAVEDITDTQKQNEENRKAMETAFHAAEAASHAKSEFLSRMSHDIRTPMNAIVGLTAIMGAHLDDRERIVDCLTKITSSSKHLLGLINEVLDMSKIESGKLALSETEFSLPALVDDLLSIIQPTINAKHQYLTVNIQDIKHENVIGDNVRLQQVFVNILSNAVKYTEEYGHIKITISERTNGQPLIGKYKFVFEDDGIGMTPEFLEKVFSPFERAEDERVSHVQGTGLGMSIAQSIIRLMGGTITVESEVGKGTKFTVSVSMRLQDINDADEERLVGLPVLVADDEQIACETACLMLNELGMNSEWVLTGSEAVDRVSAHHKAGEDFFAVILDWKMPGMDGVETARAIRREIGPDVPIIILSAYDWSDIENEARAAGVNMFIGKPLFKSRLKGVFMEIISNNHGSAPDPLDSIKASDFSGKRALLVEDNELNQEIAKEILEMMNIDVDVAENGKVAVGMFSDESVNYYDIILMDIQMPIMNGLEASRAIRALDRPDAKTTPIVAMTANTFSEDVQASLEAGMVQHIGKPLDMKQLTAVLDKWLKKNAAVK